jgi:hypothetical protein
VIVVHYQGSGTHDNVALDVNAVARRYLRLPVNAATVFDDDHRLALFFVEAIDAKVNVLPNED